MPTIAIKCFCVTLQNTINFHKSDHSMFYISVRILFHKKSAMSRSAFLSFYGNIDVLLVSFPSYYLAFVLCLMNLEQQPSNWYCYLFEFVFHERLKPSFSSGLFEWMEITSISKYCFAHGIRKWLESSSVFCK